MQTLPFVFTIDTEEGWDWNAGWPQSGYSLENIEALPRYQALCARYRVPTTWFVDWPVMSNARAREVVLGLRAGGRAEIGMHVHPWATPPFDGSLEGTARGSFLERYPRQLALAKLDRTFEVFAEQGVRPRSFRGGRFSCGAVGREFLAGHGFVADSSIVPFTTWPDDGAPDYRHEEGACARLADSESGGLWELPVTVRYTRDPAQAWRRRFEFLGQGWRRNLRVEGILDHLGVVRRIWLNVETTSAHRLLELLSLEVARRVQASATDLPAAGAVKGSAPWCLCAMVHSSSLQVGGNPYSRTRADVERTWNTTQRVLEFVSSDSRLTAMTMSDVAQSFEVRHASHRP